MNEARGPFSPEIHGPFLPEHYVTIDGYKVPYLTVRPTDDGRVDVMIDRRFGIDGPVSLEEFDRWMPILAHGMAVAAGYSCHGENCTPLNPFKHRMGPLGSMSPEFTVIDGGKDK